MTTTTARPAAQQPFNTLTSDDLITLASSDASRPGNVRAALDEAISEARAAETATDYSKAVQRAWEALSTLCDNAVTCRCGGLLDRLTGICGECVAKREQLDADFAHIDVLLSDIDEACGF